MEGNIGSVYSINNFTVTNMQRVSTNLNKKNSKRSKITTPIHRKIKRKGPKTYFKMHAHS